MPKFLVVKLAAIGDAVLSLAALDALREEHPGAQITALMGHACAPVAEHHPALDRLWRIDETIFWKKRPVALLKLAWALRKERFDRVFILHWSPLFHHYFKWIGIPDRWGFAREGKASALTRQVPYVEASPAVHDVAQYLSAVSRNYSACAIPARAPHIHLIADETAWASAARGREKLTVAIAPGGGNNPKLFMPQKRWLTQRFIELGERLIRDQQAQLFVLGDASEKALLAPLASRLPERVKVFAGQASLRQTAALIKASQLFIGNDSGLLHVSGAVGTPSLSFFGPTSPLGKLPVWLSHQVLYTQEACSPCYKHGFAPPCPYELKCMTHISTDAAYQAVLRLLEGSHATAS